MAYDYIPKNDDELLVFAENLYAYALVRGVAFAHRMRGPEEAPAKAEDMPSVSQTATVKNFQ
jgi:hypothetical protein